MQIFKQKNIYLAFESTTGAKVDVSTDFGRQAKKKKRFERPVDPMQEVMEAAIKAKAMKVMEEMHK